MTRERQQSYRAALWLACGLYLAACALPATKPWRSTGLAGGSELHYVTAYGIPQAACRSHEAFRPRSEVGMKLSVKEIIILVVAVVIVAPIVVVLISPSPEVITMGCLWLGVIAVFLIGFFLVRRPARRDEGGTPAATSPPLPFRGLGM